MFTDLYHINKIDFNEGQLTASVTLNESHDIFDGHFPGQPVLPGVCQLALIKDLVQRHLNRNLITQKADQVKFLSMIDPRRTPVLDVTITISENEGQIVAQAVISVGETTFLKSKCRFADAC